MEDKLDEIINLLKLQVELLDKIFKILNTTNDEYLTEMNKEDLIQE